MNFVASTEKLLAQNLSAEEFINRFREELILYHDETGYPTVSPPRHSPNPEKERGLSTIHFDFMKFFFQWSIKIEDWRDLQPLMVEFIRDYLASAETDPRKMVGHKILEKKCRERIQELARSGKYPADEVRYQWFDGGN